MTEPKTSPAALNFETAALKAAEKVYASGEQKINDGSIANLLLANAAVKKYVDDMQGCATSDPKAKAEVDRYSKLSAVFSEAIKTGKINNNEAALADIRSLTATMQSESLSTPRIQCSNTQKLR